MAELLSYPHPVVATAKTGQHFVADGVAPSAEFLDRDAVPDQSRKVATTHARLGKSGDVERHEVHGDSSDQRATPLCNNRLRGFTLAGSAQIAVGIADGNHSDPRCPRGSPGCAVAYGGTTGDVPYLDDAGLEGDDLIHEILHRGRGVDAVKCSARTNHVAMGGRSEEDARRIGERCRRSAEQET
jgi:hypothetical protein